MLSVAGQRVASPALIGRADDLERIVEVLSDPPTLVFVEGEAGIGKTRLVRECLATSELTGRRMMVAACPPLAEPFPLGPVVDGIRRLQPRLDQLGLSPLAGALRPLFPEWSEQLPPALEQLDDSAETRHRLLRALTELIDRLGVELLVVEDAHWGDAATMEWLLTLATSGDPGISIVVTFRPTDVAEGSLVLRLTSSPLARTTRVRVQLGPLDVAGTRDLVGSMLGTDAVSEQFAVFLHEHTDGVPLAVEETISLLRERHDIIRQHGSWTRRVLDELEVPPTLRDSILDRAGRLPPEGRAVLRAAAILAEPADEVTLAAVSGLDEPLAERGITAALLSGLLRETGSGRLVFRHVLDAQAILEGLPAPERWAFHRRAVEYLLRLQPQSVVRLAHHCHGAGDTEQWGHYAEAAAELALESGDEHTAVGMLHELLTSIPHPPDRRVRLGRRLGEVTVNRSASLGGLESAVRDSLAGLLTDKDIPEVERGEVRLLLGWLLFQLGEFEAGHAEFEAAVDELGGRPARAARAMLFLATPEAPRSWTAARHLQWLERATHLIPKVESDAERQALAIDRVVLLLRLGEEAGWQAAAEISQSAATRAERRQILGGLLNIAQHAIDWGRYAEARQRLSAAAESARATGFQRAESFVRFDAALLDWYTGAWNGLDEKVDEIGDADETHPLIKLGARSIRAMLQLARGNRATAEQGMRQVLDRATDTMDDPTALAAVALGRLYLADGEAQKAVAVTAARMDVIAGKGIWLGATDVAAVHLDALIEIGELSRAIDLVDEFADCMASHTAPAPAAALLTCRAIVAAAQGSHGPAEALLAEAATAWAELPRPYDELLTHERRGQCLLASGEHDEAMAVLSDTQQRLSDLGARWDADRVARLLRQHGIEVVRTWRRGRHGYGDQLSPRELEVVQLVAQGMTNKQVAEILFISPRTVHRHLSAAMRKLEVSSRTAVAMAAAAAGLLTADDHP